MNETKSSTTDADITTLVDPLVGKGYEKSDKFTAPSEHLEYVSGRTRSVLYVNESAPSDVPRIYTLHDWS